MRVDKATLCTKHATYRTVAIIIIYNCVVYFTVLDDFLRTEGND